MKLGFAAVAAACFVAGGAQAATSIYFNDFSDGFDSAVIASGVTVTNPSASFATLPTAAGGASGGIYHRTDAGVVTFTLSNLPSHDKLYLNFTGILVDSWDGGGSSSVAPDFLRVTIDGVQHDITADNYNNCCAQLDGGTETYYGNFFYSSWNDRVFSSAVYEIAHTGSTFTFSFQAAGSGFQFGTDESWAIDNLSVTADLTNGGGAGGVPEPGTWALMILGFGAAGASLRRRRAALA